MEITSRIHRVDGMGRVNAYLYLAEDGSVVAIDTGVPGNADRIVRQVGALGRRPEELVLILLTHPDVDHCGSAAELRRLTGARIAIHEVDAPGVAGEKGFVRARGLRGLILGVVKHLFRFEAVRPDLTLKGGETVGGLEVVHTPGHTQGSICLYEPGKALFVGDALRTDRGGNPLAPSRNLSWDDLEARESLNKIAELDFDALLPGHGEPIAHAAGDKVRKWLDN